MNSVIILLILLFDRLTKVWAVKKLKDFNDIIIIDNFFKFSYLENKGAAWGILRNNLLFLILITSIVLFCMLYYLIQYKPSDKLFNISFAMIIGGAIGNLYDRIVYNHVVDFITLHYKETYYFPTFNVADMFISIGTVLLIIYIIKDGI